MNFGVSDWVAIGSAALAVISLVLNWVVVRRQTALQFEQLKAEMDAEVIAWAHEAIELVSHAASLARGRGVKYTPQEFGPLAYEASARISAAADKGRLFFPNESPDEHGRDKEAAFQGYRQPILDTLVFACGRLDRMDPTAATPDTDAAEFLTKCRRLLVSEAQNAIDPRRRGQMLRRLATGRMDDKVSAFAAAAELGEAMEALYPGYLEQRRDATWIARREEMARRRVRG